MSNPDFALAESVPSTNASYFILVYLLVLIYCCLALAIVCDVYFVPALQKLSYTYDLPPDIAGSTLMALGASVPELFASLIGVFVTQDDIGTGSIIGSSCFNLIAVPAACALVASATFKKKLNINPLPVIRNSTFYAITILVLVLIIKDNRVDIPEAIILLLFFVMYMSFMILSVRSKKNSSTPASAIDSNNNSSNSNSITHSYTSADSAIAECSDNNSKYHQARYQCIHNDKPSQQQLQQIYGQLYCASDSRLINAVRPKTNSNERTPLVSDARTRYTQLPLADTGALNSDQRSSISYIQQQQQQSQATAYTLHSQPFVYPQLDASVMLDLGIAVKNSAYLNSCSIDNFERELEVGLHKSRAQSEQKLDEHDEHSGWLSSAWILISMLPLTLSMKVLAPCKFKNTCWTIWTFLVSIGLIGGLTYVSVWMVHSLSQCLGISDTVAGMTILSWGTGIPELIASIVLIKKTAQADMAICNTIGSNVIDISFCLSLPWIIKCIMNKSSGLRPEVAIQSAALPWTSLLLLISVVLLILILKLHDWVLSFGVGFWLLLVYIVFVISATYLESSFSETGLDVLAMI